MIKLKHKYIFLLLLVGLYSYAKEFYWETPEQLSKKNGQFLQSAFNKNISVVVWEEDVKKNNMEGNVFISLSVYVNNKWNTYERISEPIPYVANIPSIVSVAVTDDNSILITYIKNRNTIVILQSKDNGKNFARKEIKSDIYDLVSPYISITSKGDYLLFVEYGHDEQFSIFYSLSQNGINWTEFKEFAINKKKYRNFLPVHTHSEKSDVIVFQSLDRVDEKLVYSLYSSYSTDGGKSWSEPINITGIDYTQNQRPYIYYSKKQKKIYAVWERAKNQKQNSITAFAELNITGERISEIEEINHINNHAISPKIVEYQNSPLISWTEEYEKKGTLCVATKNNSKWQISVIRSVNGKLIFAQPFIIDENIRLVWHEGLTTQTVMQIQPDYRTLPPRLIPTDFTAKTKEGKKLLTVKIKFPEDSSGIAGYAFEWKKDEPPEFIEPTIANSKTVSKLIYDPEEDGIWYLGVRICDYAGNWSDMAVVACQQDSTPPQPPVFELITLDKDGFVPSNTFEFKWKAPELDINSKPETIKGYIQRIQYIEDIAKFKSRIKKENIDTLNDEAIQDATHSKFSAKLNSSKLNTTAQKLQIENYENGLYALIVSAVDEAGNISEQAVKFFALNKYKPYTLVSNIETTKNRDGTVKATIIGKGFTADGTIEKIYIDTDGQEPYNLTINKKDFTVINDKLISNIGIDDLDKGSYKIGLQHSTRGLYFAPEPIFIDDIGNLKFGDYSNTTKQNWIVTEYTKNNFYNLYILLTIFVIAFILMFSVIQIIKSLQEANIIKKEVKALLTGGTMSIEKRKKITALQVQSGGLRLKFVLFTTILVLSVILILAIPLGSRFSETQERILGESLLSRTNVLLDALVSGTKAYLPSKNLLEIAFLPSQISALKEANFAIITGEHINSKNEGYNFVWASNDKDIQNKINTKELISGESELHIENLDLILQKINSIDDEAKMNAAKLSEQLDSLTHNIMDIAFSKNIKSKDRLNEVQSITRQIEEKLNKELINLSAKGTGSYPEFNPQHLSEDITEYLFYKPILYRQPGSIESFVHGIVYVQISTDEVLKQIEDANNSLRKMIIYIALISLSAGIVGALLLSSIIVTPLKKLVKHVAMISETEDKEKLADKAIKIKSKDEIGILGRTINEMTNSLAQAAAASKDLTVGKEIQKMFLPLQTDELGKKLTCSEFKNDNTEFFGYYEGARGVSGDYFNYIKLNDRYFAIIKCDVAGKGVPAALIMVEVATLFLDYFKDWQFKTHGFKIDSLVSRINDLIESRGFKGRFAAFTLCIFDSISGEVHFCNAGDNMVNIYDAASKKMKEVILTEISAAGVFPSFMIDMKGGFKVEKIKLNKGDVLFLYTDGIEEAKRLFRNSKLEQVLCEEKGLKIDDVHETHTVGQDGEELGKERVCEIIENIFARTSFNLTKWHNPIKDEEFNFDFSTLDGSIEDAVIGLVSVEKIFRMYRDPKATELNLVKADKKIDLFLNKHFRQYQTYCGNKKPNNEANEYLYYTNIREDAQYDDLTILAIKKK